MRGFTKEESEAASRVYEKRSEPTGESPFKETIKQRIIDLLNKQCAKGEAKYGHTLDECPDGKFDWRLMAMEELIDLVQYQQKEIMRLEKENKELKSEVEVLHRSHW